MLAVTTDDMQTVALVVLAGIVVVGLASALLMKAVVGKVISVALMAVVGGAVWSQRSSIHDCADKVKTTATTKPPNPSATTCSFFGFEVDLPTD